MKMIAALLVILIMLVVVAGLSLNKLGWVTLKQPKLVPYEILEIEPKPEVKIDLIPEIKKIAPVPEIKKVDPAPIPKPPAKVINKTKEQSKLKAPTNIVPPLPKTKPEAEPEKVKDRSECSRDPGWR